MRFRPKLGPTIIAIVGVAILIGLGTWQLHRRAWKEDLLATIASRMAAEPTALSDTIDDPAAWAFRRVRVVGRFADDHALWLYGRTYDGKAGVHLLVPTIRDRGAAVLVDRGFVPFDHGSTLAPFVAVEGTAEIDGVARVPEPPGWFSPANKHADNIWYDVDIAAMSRATGLALAPIYVAARPSGATAWPAGTGGTETLGIRNEHLNYAIFWYTMAAALAVIYLLSSTSRRS